MTARAAIVTGGGRGLGRAMVLGLAQAGMRVLATAARESSEVEAVADQAATSTGEHRVLPLTADVTRPEDCQRVVDIALEHFGRLDVLVNNAGRGMKYVSEQFMTEPSQFWKADPDAWRLVIDTNVNGPFLMARAAVPAMLDAGWGRIINVSMNRETMRRRGFSPYGPSKAALESETLIWAQDLDGTGVTVNALLPGGATMTGMIPDGMDSSLQAGLLQPDVMVDPLLWLVSRSADAVTGKRVVANRWPARLDDDAHSHAAVEPIEDAGW
jgi:3-oxoacyl-[acyl-carrier protein] reductase